MKLEQFLSSQTVGVFIEYANRLINIYSLNTPIHARLKNRWSSSVRITPVCVTYFGMLAIQIGVTKFASNER